MEGLARVCLDTDVLIDFMKKPSDITKRTMQGFLENKVSVCTTSINTFELWLGAHLAPEEMKIVKETEDFLGQIEVMNFDYEASIEASRVLANLRKRGRIIEIRDLFVGCVCKVASTHLITRNLKHYRRIRGLRVLTPEQALKKLRL